MPERVHLPEPLRTRPFSIAEAREAGLGRGRLLGPDLDRPFYGVRSQILTDKVSAYAPRLRPGDRFSHTTAARLWGAPIPREREDDVHVTATGGTVRPRAKGVIGHRSAARDITVRKHLPVSSPVATFLECALVLDVESLVMVGDHLILDPRVLDPHDIRPHVALGDLSRGVVSATGRGAVRAREALALVRDGVESPMETRLRLLLARAGLPEPVCGYELRTRRGRRIGWFDLAWPDRRLIVEYDGDQHRTSTSQYERDIRRFDDATAEGWNVIRVRSHGVLRSPQSTVARVARGLAP